MPSAVSDGIVAIVAIGLAFLGLVLLARWTVRSLRRRREGRIPVAGFEAEPAAHEPVEETVEETAARPEAAQGENQGVNRGILALIKAQRAVSPATVVGLPSFAAIEAGIGRLRLYREEVDVIRPVAQATVDASLREVAYAPFPRKRPWGGEGRADGTEPIEMTPDALAVAPGDLVEAALQEAEARRAFPAKEPIVTFDPPPIPSPPEILDPAARIEVVVRRPDGAEIDLDTPFLREVYEPELTAAAEARERLRALAAELKAERRLAREAFERAGGHIAAERMNAAAVWSGLSQDYHAHRRRYEAAWAADTRRVRAAVSDHTPGGIETRFHFALELLPLPLPTRFSWQVAYDARKKLLEVRQEVPAIAGVTLKKAKGDEPLPASEADHVRRRLLPSIALRIAGHVARTDIRDEVAVVAVNLWSRFNDRATGRLKDAYVLAVHADKAALPGLDIGRADPLRVFRTLGGTYVYNPDRVVPIQPEIELHREAGRFIDGWEVLAGLASGQNLATMDWHDFEHLMRDVLRKEFGRDGAEVAITRTGRDLGLDAVAAGRPPASAGPVLIRVRRLAGDLGADAVRNLSAAVDGAGAAHGVLVATAGFDPDARAAAADKPLTLIDGKGLLVMLARHGYRFRIDLAEAAKASA